MNYVKSDLFKIQLLLQLVIGIFFYFLDLTTEFQTIFAGILLCIVGIPHGANDYLYRKDKSTIGIIKFLSIYLFSMLVYFAIWWFFSLIALLAFFIISFHHFGQSNFGNKSFWYLPSLLWGIWILLFPVLLHFDEAFIIFNQMIEGKDFKQPLLAMPEIIDNWQIMSASVFALFYIAILFIQEKSNLFVYVVQFFFVSIWIAITPLLFGFILIFCLWHSLQSVQHQVHYYKIAMNGTSLDFFKAIFPFSLMALLFFGLYIFFRGFQLSEAFILLSLITLPHVIVMHRLYGEDN